MNELALLHPEQLPGNLSTEEIDAAMAYATASHANSTLVAYAADYAAWVAFALARNACPMPAHAGVVAAWLSAQADAGRKASSIGRAAAALAYYSKQNGIDPPVTATAGVRAVMKGIRRTLGTAPVKKHAATADIVMKMLATCGDDLIGRRDRALIAVGMAGAFRRSELIALTTDDLETTKEGLLVTIRRSKGDQEGAGQVVSLPHGHHIRPVEALAQWLEAAGIASDSGSVLFRPVRRGGKVVDAAMKVNDVARVVKKLVSRTGLDASVFSAHSLRSGFLSSAAAGNASIWKMQEQSRHRNLDVLAGYVQSKNRFVEHAGSSFL